MTKVVPTSLSISITISIILVLCGESLTVSIPVTMKPPPPPSPSDDCKLTGTGTRLNPYSILAQLKSGHLSADQLPDVASGYSPFYNARCEDGPRTVIYSVPNEFHWPPVYVGSCDGLLCTTSSCNVRSEVLITKCVLVFQLINGSWAFAGPQNRLFVDHTECKCNQCSDISDMLLCAQTKACPDRLSNSSSYCFWNSSTDIPPMEPPTKITPNPVPSPGSCDCCTPTSCPQPKIFNREMCLCDCPTIGCPPSQTFNDSTCECECLEGSVKNRVGECVGSCENVSLTYCQFVTCEDNPLFQCKVDDQTCVCPSCDDVGSSVLRCKRTKCLEQQSNPRCIFDNFVRKCRCPSEYDDQKDLL